MLSPDQQSMFMCLFKEYYENMAKYLVNMHKDLQNRERQNRQTIGVSKYKWSKWKWFLKIISVVMTTFDIRVKCPHGGGIFEHRYRLENNSSSVIVLLLWTLPWQINWHGVHRDRCWYLTWLVSLIFSGLYPGDYFQEGPRLKWKVLE